MDLTVTTAVQLISHWCIDQCQLSLGAPSTSGALGNCCADWTLFGTVFFHCLWSGCNIAVCLTEMFRWLLVAGRHRLTDSQWVRDGQSGSQWPGLRWWLCRHLPLPGNKELFCPDSPFQVEEKNICPHVVICSPWWWLNVLYHLNQ